MAPSITAIIVSFDDPSAARRAARSLLDQVLPPAEVLVVDNDPRGTAAAQMPAEVSVLHPKSNLGYTGAANLAATRARGDWLFFLNPDATASPDCLVRLLEAVDGPEVAIVGAQVLLPDGRVNAGDNPVNIAGISWSGRYGGPREDGPPRDVAAVSGAALLARRDWFLAVGGLCPFFFAYVDDTDLAWRTRLNGGRVRYCPAAIVVHEYQFDKGPSKWFYLERNRDWAVLSNLQLRTLVLLAPLLIATEAAVLVRAARHGWLGEKARAWWALLQHLPDLIRWRRQVQTRRRVPDGPVLVLFRGGVETDLIGGGLPKWVNRWLETYRRVLLRLLRTPEDRLQ